MKVLFRCLIIFCLTNFIAFNRVECQNIDYLIENPTISDRTYDSFTVSWTNPTINFDSIQLNYLIYHNNLNLTLTLDKSLTSYKFSQLLPGTVIIIILKTILNNNVMAQTASFNGNSLLPPVLNITTLSTTSTEIELGFKPPTSGLYDSFLIVAWAMDTDYNGLQALPVEKNKTQAKLVDLIPGTVYEIAISTFINNGLQDDLLSDILKREEKTKLDTAYANIKEVKSSVLTVDSFIVNGNFDKLIIKLVLVSTDFYKFTINKNLTRKECEKNQVLIKEAIYEDSTENIKPVDFEDICPMSTYNVTIATVLEGFEDAVAKFSAKTRYENVNCENIYLKTVSDKTTFFWPNSSMPVDSYIINITRVETNEKVFSKLVNSKLNQLELEDLGYETNYEFEIAVRSEKNKIVSASCTKQLQTGPPCPVYDDNVETKKFYAPYVDQVFISVPNNTFTSTHLIEKIEIIVGVGESCSGLSYETDKLCYLASSWEPKEFYDLYEEANEAIIIRLSTEVNCNNKKECDIRFILDKNYYITIKAEGPCGSVESNTLVLMVPSPFPLGLAISVTIGVIAAILAVVFAVICFITIKHVKRKHNEELALLIDSNQIKENVVQTPF